jgi:hypothetical protein
MAHDEAAFINGQKELVMSFGQFSSANESRGISMQSRAMWVAITGASGPAETIAKLFAESSMSSLGKR